MIDLEPCAYGTHRLRRTKVALIYKKRRNTETILRRPYAL